MKRICELLTGDIFYRGINRCKVISIKDGVLHYATWYENRFHKHTKNNVFRSNSKELVKVPDGDVIGSI